MPPSHHGLVDIPSPVPTVFRTLPRDHKSKRNEERQRRCAFGEPAFCVSARAPRLPLQISRSYGHTCRRVATTYTGAIRNLPNSSDGGGAEALRFRSAPDDMVVSIIVSLRFHHLSPILKNVIITITHRALFALAATSRPCNRQRMATRARKEGTDILVPGPVPVVWEEWCPHAARVIAPTLQDNGACRSAHALPRRRENSSYAVSAPCTCARQRQCPPLLPPPQGRSQSRSRSWKRNGNSLGLPAPVLLKLLHWFDGPRVSLLDR